MDKRDRDDLDRHIEASDDELMERWATQNAQQDAIEAGADPLDVIPELSEQDSRDLAVLGGDEAQNPDAPPIREIKRTFDTYAHDELPSDGGDRETWAQGQTVFIDEHGTEHVVHFRLDSGAGLGSSHLSFAVDVDEQRFVREYVDVTTLISDWLASVAGDWISDRLVPKTGEGD